MGDTATIDRQTVRAVLVGALSAGAVVAGVALVQLRGENQELRSDIVQLRKRIDTYQQAATTAPAPRGAVAIAAATPAPVQPPAPAPAQVQAPAALEVHPAQSTPAVPGAQQPGAPNMDMSLAWSLMRPSDTVRPPLPLAAPGAMKSKSAPSKSRAPERTYDAPPVADAKTQPVEAMQQLDGGADAPSTAPAQTTLSLLEQ